MLFYKATELSTNKLNLVFKFLYDNMITEISSLFRKVMEKG